MPSSTLPFINVYRFRLHNRTETGFLADPLFITNMNWPLTLNSCYIIEYVWFSVSPIMNSIDVLIFVHPLWFYIRDKWMDRMLENLFETCA